MHTLLSRFSKHPIASPLARVWKALSASAVLFAAIASASAEIPAVSPLAIRIPVEISSANPVQLPTTRHPLAQARNETGRVPAQTMLQGMSLVFSRTPAQQADLKSLLADQQNPASPSYHKWLTPDQFAARFGVAQADLDKASQWLEQQGFTVTRAARSRNRIYFSGTVRQAETAFATELHYYHLNQSNEPKAEGYKPFAPSKAISLPAALANVVEEVTGLNSIRPTPMIRRRTDAPAKPNFTSGISGTVFTGPGDAQTIYDVNAAYHAGITGAGQSIAIVGETTIDPIDIENFQLASGWATPKDPVQVLVPDSGLADNYYTGDFTESDLDLEWSSTMAPGATIYFVFTGDSQSANIWDSLTYAVDERISPIISVSYGGCEAAFPSSLIASLEDVNQQGAAQGQSILIASGDSGSTTCAGDDGLPQEYDLAVSYPASSAYVTAVGGTEFNEGSGNYWSSTPGTDIISSAISYIPEMVWNEDYAQGLGSGGGGASILFTKPTWQTGVPGIPNDGARDLPDISLDAAGQHDGLLFCSQDPYGWHSGQQNSCNEGFRDSATGDLTFAGGTSFAAPMFAGMLALVNQYSNSTGQGLLNTRLYQLASNPGVYSSAFHDITVGSNDCTSSDTVNICPNGPIGFSAAPGYDLATGIGSIDLNNLISAWGASNLAPTATSITAATLTPVAGATDALTITVAPTAGSGVPTGTIALTVDGATVTPALELANGSVQYTTAPLTGSGNHIAVAIYSGDATYAQSTSTLSINANISTATTITPSNSQPTVNQSDTFTIAVEPEIGLNHPTGTVAISVDGVTVAGSVALSTNSLATYSTSFTTTGAHTVQAVYAGTADFATSTGTVTVNVLPVVTAAVATTMSISAASSAPNVNVNDTFTIHVTPASGTATPSGTVAVTVDGAAVATPPTLANGVATFTTSFTTAGAHTVSASFAATSAFLASSSSVTVTVSQESFTLSSSGVSVSQGSTGTAAITVTPANGYSGTVSFAVSASPSVANTCFSLPTATVSAGTAATATLTIATNTAICPTGSTAIAKLGGNPTSGPDNTPASGGQLKIAAAATLAGLLFAGFLGRASRRLRLLGALAVILAVGLIASGCGSNSKQSASAAVTPKGSYTLTVTATDTASSAITGSAKVTLTVN